MANRDFEDLDSTGVPLDATPQEMRDWINGAIAHRKVQSARLLALESSQADLKDGQQVLYDGHRRLEASQREVLLQLASNTATTNATAATAERTEGYVKVIAAWMDALETLGKAIDVIAKVARPVGRCISACTWVAVRLGLIGGLGVGGWKLAGEWVMKLFGSRS